MEEKYNKMPLIGDIAPSFKAITTNGDINFPEDYKGKWVILFSHPGDFTPVCTTEFMTFGFMSNEFKQINTELIGLSIDSNLSHIEWLRVIEKLKWNGKNNINITFPVIADTKMEVATKYGMIHENQSDTKTVRAVFIIDPESKIRTILYYPQSIGRNFKEIKRIVMALQKTDSDKCLAPADWEPGDDVIIPPVTTFKASNEIELADDSYYLDWFLCFKKDNMHREIK